MENVRPTPAEAAVALDEAESARARLAGGLVLPSAFLTSIGVAIAVQIASAATGISSQDSRGVLLAGAGLAVFALTAVVQLERFRRCNGVWLAGLASHVVLGTAAVGSGVYAAAFSGAVWSAFAGAWWLVATSSVAGGVGYGLCGRRWVSTYRSDPGTHGRPESTAWWAVLALTGLVGLVALVIQR